MKNKRNIIALAACALAASACATDDHAGPQAQNPDWTDVEQAAYDQCLQDNMAVATAWEMIEQSCREQVDGGTDPLGLSVEE